MGKRDSLILLAVLMRSATAREVKYDFGRLIDFARAAPVAVAKHGWPVVVVFAAEEFERLTTNFGGAIPKPTSAYRVP